MDFYSKHLDHMDTYHISGKVSKTCLRPSHTSASAFSLLNYTVLKYFDCLEHFGLLLDVVLISRLVSQALLLLIKSSVTSKVMSSSPSSGSSYSSMSLFSIWEHFTSGFSQFKSDILAFSMLEHISNTSFE